MVVDLVTMTDTAKSPVFCPSLRIFAPFYTVAGTDKGTGPSQKGQARSQKNLCFVHYFLAVAFFAGAFFAAGAVFFAAAVVFFAAAGAFLVAAAVVFAATFLSLGAGSGPT